MSRQAAVILIGHGLLLLTLLLFGTMDTFRQKWDPVRTTVAPVSEVIRMAYLGSVRSTPHWWTLQPLMTILLFPAGVMVLLGLTSVARVAAGRRPWPWPPTDALFLVGTVLAVSVLVLHIETALLERSHVLATWGPRAPSAPVLLDDFLRVAVVPAALLYCGLAVFSLGLLDRWRQRRIPPPGLPAPSVGE